MTLKATVQEAREDDRLICGVYECSKMLKNMPEDVALCVLAEINMTGDVSVHIQHKLLETFCLENDIQIVHVNSLRVDCGMLPDEKTAGIQDVDCILVQNIRYRPPALSDYIVHAEMPLRELTMRPDMYPSNLL